MNRGNFFLALFLVSFVSISQFILANEHLEFGFFTDDWLFLSAYRAYVANPILDLLNAWKNIGSHNFAHAYYIGVLYNFFGLDYFSYHLLNQILKIVATLSLYPLVYIISKNKLLAFLSTVFFSIHYSPFGTLDNASRGEDFIAITSMNLFLCAYIYIIKKTISNIFLFFTFAIWLFATVFIDPTRLFPLIVIVPLIEFFNFLQNKTRKQLKISTKRMLVIYSPFIPLLIFSPESILVQVRYSIGIFEKISYGNWQLFLTPFAAFGSTYIPKQLWFLFGNPVYGNLGSYLTFLLFGPILLFLIIQSILGFFVSKKPLKFILTCFGLNLLFGLIVFFLSNNWLFLNQETRAPVDPGTYIIPSLIGIFIAISSFILFLEWRESNKRDNLQFILFIGAIFSLFFIFMTWLFADFNSIFTTVHAYLNIPAIGASIFLATLLVMVYKKLALGKNSRIVSILILLIIIGIYFKMSSIATNEYFSYWLNNGLRATDQKKIMNQFWTELDYSKNYNLESLPLIYLDTSEDYNNGIFYSEAIIWQLASWFDLRFYKNKEGRFTLCDLMILDKSELENSLNYINGKKIFVRYKCNKDGVVYKTENFFAFKLINRNLIPNRREVLTKLGIE